MMKTLQNWEIDRMNRRLKAAAGRIPASEIHRLTAIARLAAVGKQLPMEEWTLFDQVLSGYEAQAPEEKEKNAERAERQEEERDEEQESVGLYVQAMLRIQNEPHSGRRARR